MNCPKCGQEYKEPVRSCVACGISLADTSEPSEDSREEKSDNKSYRFNERYNWFLLPILSAVVLILGLVVYLFVSSSGSNGSAPITGSDKSFYSSGQAGSSSVKPANKRELNLFIKGFKCSSCSYGVKSALLKNQGVVKASIENNGRAKIIYDSSKTSQKEILDSIRQLGYKPKL